MKIAISYPPLESKKGTPLLSQNRQFQWFQNPTFIYPVIPAYAATLLKKNSYAVFWDDGIAEGLSYPEWKARIIREQPDIIAMETKTPVIERHWKIIEDLKKSFEIENLKLKIVLMGDHVTALPEESLKKSGVDFVMASGDYDFMLLNLADHLEKNTPLEGGFYYWENGQIVNSGPTELHPVKSSSLEDAPGVFNGVKKHDLDTLPIIDRELTRWKNYAFKNGNFKHFPGAYIMSARDCWWGQCTFCSWTTMFPGESFRTMSPKKALDEIGNLIRLGAKEIMEDSGSLPVGAWLQEFCQGMIARGYNRQIKIDCNMRLNGIRDKATWQLMKKAGFRLVLFGLESANQLTLDRINKNLKVEEIEPALKNCKEAGLSPHITVMIGYPWEDKKMASKTVALAKDLFRKDYAETLQATLVMPYPGTPLYKQCLENNWLLTQAYSKFDQKEAVIKSPLTVADTKELIRDLYKSFLTPKFVLKKMASIRSFDDMRFIWNSGLRVLGHLKDFSQKPHR